MSKLVAAGGARLLFSALALLTAAAVAQAQPGLGRGPAGDESEATRAARREAREKLKKEVLGQMRAMRMWKLTEELKLDQATAAKVFPVLADFDERGRALGRERGDIAREFHALAPPDKAPDNQKLKPLIERLLVNQQKRNALDEERFKALRPALTPVQQAKILLLLPRIDDDFRQRIREAMDARRRAERGEASVLPRSGN